MQLKGDMNAYTLYLQLMFQYNILNIEMIQERSKWLPSWMHRWIIHSTDFQINLARKHQCSKTCTSALALSETICRNSKDKYNINYDVSKMFFFYGCVKSESYLQSSNFLFDIA